MSVPANTVQTFAAVGIREDLSDTITMISPYDTPLYTMARKGKTGSTTPEWQKDDLRDANPENKVIQGADVTGDPVGQPEKLKNVTQLLDEVVVVSTTAEATTMAGRKSEMGRAVAKAGKALKTDVEARSTGNYASVNGNATTPAEMGGLEAWIETNIDTGAGYTSGGYDPATNLIVAATDGTQRDITEDALKNVILKCWQAGGMPTTVMVGGSTKQKISSEFTGIATQYKDNKSNKNITILGAVDIYKSDFGEHRIVPNRFQRDRTALVLSPNTIEAKFLQPWKTEELAKNGHNTRKLLCAELTICVTDEKANGKVSDLNVAA